MKLLASPTSPFARKVLVAAIELGLDSRIERTDAAVSPTNRNQTVIAHNPLGQVPTLVADDGVVLYDSRVIAEYLDHLAGGGRVFPVPGPARWRALTEQALADGIIDAALLARYETASRPAMLLWEDWRTGQLDKVQKGLERLERQVGDLGSRIDIGTISVACALGYLDLRFADLDWRSAAPRLAAWFATFAARPSMKATEPRP